MKKRKKESTAFNVFSLYEKCWDPLEDFLVAGVATFALAFNNAANTISKYLPLPL